MSVCLMPGFPARTIVDFLFVILSLLSDRKSLDVEYHTFDFFFYISNNKHKPQLMLIKDVLLGIDFLYLFTKVRDYRSIHQTFDNLSNLSSRRI